MSKSTIMFALTEDGDVVFTGIAIKADLDKMHYSDASELVDPDRDIFSKFQTLLEVFDPEDEGEEIDDGIETADPEPDDDPLDDHPDERPYRG